MKSNKEGGEIMSAGKWRATPFGLPSSKFGAGETIHFDPSQAGSKRYLRARWVSKNKQASKGPWSEVFIAVVGG